MNTIRVLEGFRDQHLFRLPHPVRERWGGHPLLQALMPTDIGWFPKARHHYCARPDGADEHILIFCVGGAGWLELAGESVPVVANEAIFIPRHIAHVYGAASADPWSIHWVHLVGTEIDFFMGQIPRGDHKLLVDGQCRSRIEVLFRQCYEVSAEGFLLHRLLHASQVLHHLLGELLYNNPAFSPVQRTNRFRSVEPTLNYLRQNTDRPLALAEMAAHAELSVPHFSSLFKSQTGYSPKDYFIQLKVQQATSLLLLSTIPIREIARTVGYDDPYYFSRLFKKVVGVSPSKLRQEAGWQIGPENAS